MRQALVALPLVLLACSGGSSSDESTVDSGADTRAVDSAAAEDTTTSPGDTSPPIDGASTDTSATDGAPVDAAAGGLPGAATTCAPKGDACALPAADTRAFIGFRKDVYLPSSDYAEPVADPTAGGRFQVVSVSKVTGTVTGVTLDGNDSESLLVEPKLEWLHVWPKKVVAGQPIWVAFHSRDPKWDTGGSDKLVVKTDAGDALDTTVSENKSDAQFAYVTTNVERTKLLVYLRNKGASAKKVSKLIVQGRDVTDVACIADSTIAAGATTLFTVPLCAPIALGAAWTAAAEFEGGGHTAAAGRVVRPFFPVEAWPKGDDCPVPVSTAKTSEWDRHSKASFDTMYLYAGGKSSSGCTYDTFKLINEVAPARTDFWPFLGDDFLGKSNWQTALTNRDRLAGFLLGDEVDSKVYEGGVSDVARIMRDSRKLWDVYPDVPTYIGSKTNRNVGSYAGAADIQGSDFYVAACAPHITNFGTHPPLRGAYDYLRNAHDNHAPLTNWFYAQGLFSGWNKTVPVVGTEIVSQPDPSEILVQAMSVVAAGGKGVMWFQTVGAEATRAPARWQAIADSNKMIAVVRELLRSGEITGAASSTGKAIVEAVRSPDAIVVPVIGLATSAAPTDLGCQAALIGTSAVPHWKLAPQTLDVSVNVPADLGVAEVFEITPTKIVDVADPKVSGRTVTLGGVAVDDARPVRLFVFARTKELRATLAKGF